MKIPRRAAAALFDNPILVGTATILVVLVAVFLSYIAENGLPFVPTYSIKVDVSDAAQLIKNADVRIGGARVGQILSINPEPATRAYPHPYAQLGLSLDRSLQPLPMDSHYQVRLSSVLGGDYLEIIPGHARGAGLPDGGTFTLSASPKRNHELPFVDLDSALAAFGPSTRAGLRGTLAGLGDAVAGRGAQLNDALTAADELVGPLQNLLALLARPSTRLSDFLGGLAATTGALAPVAPTINTLLASGATTFQALDTSALGASLDQLPATESVATQVLTQAQPVLAETASIATALRPAAVLLPTAVTRTDTVVRAATTVFRLAPRLARTLTGATGSIDALARDPASTQTFEVLGANDLGTAGASAFVGLGAILQAVASPQFACNVAGLWVRNFAGSLSEGDTSGTWLRFAPVLDVAQSVAAAKPASDLHLNYYPVEDASQCQAGNEGYTGQQLIGNPPTTSRTVDNTTPPSGVLARGRQVGLVP